MTDDSGLFAQLEGIFDTVDNEGVINYTEWTDEALLDEYHEVMDEIREIAEVLSPRTQQGRDLHSQRYAVLLELQKRGMQ